MRYLSKHVRRKVPASATLRLRQHCKQMCAEKGCLDPWKMNDVSLGKRGLCHSYPQPAKAIYDVVKEMYPKTLSACVLLGMISRRQCPKIIFRDMVEDVMKCCTAKIPLHL